MPEDSTVPLGARSLSVGTLRVEVIDGPDRGRSTTTDDERVRIGSAAQGNTLALNDAAVSRFHLDFSRAPGGIMLIDNASTNGTWIGPLRIERAIVPPGTQIRVGASLLRVSDGGVREVPLFDGEVLGELRGRSFAMRRVMREIEQVAPSEASVLIQGESGTGKELVARAIHERSGRARHRLVTVDCASLSPTLVASELFGHERGAFTGADRQRIGSFETAHGGTLFLDEIGELPSALQAALLGALERKKIRRLGGNAEIPVDIRLISATHRDLRTEVNANTFRLDLFYRLSVVAVHLPALRDRPEDIPLLIEHFLRAAGRNEPREALVSDAALASLSTHTFPGNVRELRNLVEATLAMGTVPTVPPSTPPAPLPSGAITAARPYGDAPYGEARRAVLDEFEHRYLKALLDACGGNVSQVSRTAKMDRSHLVDLLRRHDLKR